VRDELAQALALQHRVGLRGRAVGQGDQGQAGDVQRPQPVGYVGVKGQLRQPFEHVVRSFAVPQQGEQRGSGELGERRGPSGDGEREGILQDGREPGG